MKQYIVNITIPEQAIEVDVMALSREEAKKTALQQVTLADLPSSASVGLSEGQ